MPLSNSERKALDQILDDWHCAPQSLITPYTAGSEHVLPIADFTDAHYDQQDVSLNQALWGLWPVAPPDGYDKALKQNEAKRDK